MISILAVNSSGQEQELKRIDKIAKGTLPHISASIIKKEDISKLQSDYKATKSKAGSSKKVGDIAKAIFAAAAFRDGQYATRGRMYVRAAALNGKSRAAWGRLQGLAWMEKN